MDSSLDIDDMLKDLTMLACAKIGDKILMCVIKGMIYVNTCAKDDIQRNFSLQQDVKVIPLQIREEIEERT